MLPSVLPTEGTGGVIQGSDVAPVSAKVCHITWDVPIILSSHVMVSSTDKMKHEGWSTDLI